jgi:ABC-2 type transport system ATP-binding protein
MRADSPAISVTDLCKTYRDIVAVDGVSFSVARGTIVGLLGGNGAGKTTTIAMIMGLVLPSRGTARVLGADMARARHRVLHRINFESPYVEMPKRLTVRQNLKVFGALYGVPNVGEQIAALAQELDPPASSTAPPESFPPDRRPAWRSPRR